MFAQKERNRIEKGLLLNCTQKDEQQNNSTWITLAADVCIFRITMAGTCNVPPVQKHPIDVSSFLRLFNLFIIKMTAQKMQAN